MKAVILCLAIMLSYALLVAANVNTTDSNVTMFTTQGMDGNMTTQIPDATTSGYSIVIPSVLFVGAANLLQRFF